MRIQNNIMAMNTHRQLGVNNLNQSKSTEKLSSGYRINRAADDASGLSISEKMRAQIRGLNQASSNAQDGISLVQAAEGALQETHSILQRMRELSVKAANDVNETEERVAIKAELNELTAEVDRIATTTEFNKKTLLDGSLSSAGSARVTSGKGITSTATTGGAAAGTYAVEVGTAAVKDKATLTVSTAAADEDGTLSITSNLFTGGALTVAYEDGEAVNGILSKVATAVKDQIGEDYNVTVDGNNLVIEAKEAGLKAISASAMTIADNDTGLTGPAKVTGSTTAGANAVVTVGGNAATVASGTNDVFATADGITVKLGDIETTGNKGVVTVAEGSELTLQVGANTGSDQTIAVGIDALSSAGLGLNNLKVDNHNNAQDSIAAIEAAIAKVSEQRSGLGAVQNRLEHTVANLDTVSENLSAAESRIRDVDMAKEMMAFTKNNILSQAATAMLAQANQAPQTILSLLR